MITYASMMVTMATMDREMSQNQWMMVKYKGYASNAAGKTSKGMGV